MKKKIVVLYKKVEDKDTFAQIFEDVVQQGVEIFFCENQEDAQKILESEQPHLFIVDEHFEIPQQKVPTLVLHDKKERKEGLQRPLHKSHVLEKCLPLLDLAHLENPQEIPM